MRRQKDEGDAQNHTGLLCAIVVLPLVYCVFDALRLWFNGYDAISAAFFQRYAIFQGLSLALAGIIYLLLRAQPTFEGGDPPKFLKRLTGPIVGAVLAIVFVNLGGHAITLTHVLIGAILGGIAQVLHAKCRP